MAYLHNESFTIANFAGASRPAGWEAVTVASTIVAYGTWRSLVAHLLWEQGVASSNLAVPTRRSA